MKRTALFDLIGCSMKRMVIVIPSYSEAQPLDQSKIFCFSKDNPAVCILFLNAGSADRTGAGIQAIKKARPHQADLCNFPKKSEKVEAVQRGMVRAATMGLSYFVQRICKLRT